MNPLILAGIGHLVGDYILQNDWQANGKKLRDWPCIVHCLLWTYAVLCFSASSGDVSFLGWSSVAWLFGTHFAIDRTQFIAWWMNHKGQAGFLKFAGPWSAIVVDNVFHVLTLWVAWRYLT